MKYYRIDDKKINKIYRMYIKDSLKDYDGSSIFLIYLRKYY